MKALRKDFYVQIKRTFSRFMSILLIVALGAAFFVGIRSTESDMNLSADKDYDNDNMHDIRIVGTLGLTDDDLTVIRGLDEVENADGVYNVDSVANCHGVEMTVKFMTLSDTINVPNIRDGRIPQSSKECIVDRHLAQSLGIKAGDKIKVDNDSIKYNEFTVTGLFSSASYMSTQIGSTTVGTGTLNGLVVITRDAFDVECFTDIYVTVKGAKALNTYSDEYQEVIDNAVNEIEDNVAGVRTKARYDEIVSAANEEVESARREYESGLDEYESGSRKLADGKRELTEKESELESASVFINEKIIEIESASAEYARGVYEYESGMTEYESGSIEYESGKKEYESASMELESGKAEYESGRKEYESGLAEYESGSRRYDEALKVLPEQMLVSQKVMLDEAKDELSRARVRLKKSKKKIDAADVKVSDAGNELKENEEKLSAAREELESAGVRLSQAENEIVNGYSEIEDGKRDIKEGREEISSAWIEIASQSENLKDAKKKLDDANEKIIDAKSEISEIEEPEWYVFDRNYVQTCVEYGSNAKRIGKIGTVFPIIFFIVAAMVSLNAMTRMVEEERVQIGTLRALGYGKAHIAYKYVAYGALATLIGGAVGGYLGGKLLPYIIITAYRILFINQYELILPVNLKEFATAYVAAFACVVGATIMACFNELRSVPASLMRPHAPKSGKRVLLERIPFIWKRLSFNRKSTFRNLFRYKKRLIMTLFGIGGCTALMLVGFGMRNSVHSVLPKQYGEINRYDMTVKYDTDELEKGNIKDAHAAFDKAGYVEDYMEVQAFTADVGTKDKSTLVNAHIISTADAHKLEDFVNLHDRKTGKKYNLDDDGVIISEKMSKLLGVSVGDTIFIKEGDTNTHNVVVKAIFENYSQHYVYMTDVLYDSLYDKKYEVNTAYVNFAGKVDDTDELAKKLMKSKAISRVDITENVSREFSKSLSSIDSIVFVLIISAGGLAFVVLYNLNNINIAERKRELATLKVLGFYDMEVSSYVYRENVIITIIGIILGMIFGKWLHWYVIVTAEIDMIMFGREIGTAGCVWSVLLTIVFAVFINMTMHFNLKKLDMAASLKSIE